MNFYQSFHNSNDFENINVTAINRELSHSPWGAYENEAQALSCNRTKSRWCICLDGVWKFNLYPSPERVEPFWQDGYDHSDWHDIIVPGNWELQGFSEPIYTNVSYPWSLHKAGSHVIHPYADETAAPNPPFIPDDNPIGCYYRSFILNNDWLKRDIFISFKGVEAAFYLWINGKAVGYSEDSKLPAEFNIGKYLNAGENNIALLVMRYASGSYLEDQDYWSLSGIFRSVYLYAKPKQRIVDWKIVARPDLNLKSGEVSADVTINRFDGYAKYRVRLNLYDSDGRLLASDISAIKAHAEYRSYETPTANTARLRLSIDNIRLWSPEEPYLYTATLTLLSPEGDEIDFESSRIGFRQIKIENGIIYFNGKRLIVRGVNRHEHSALTGRSLSRMQMIEEIKLMKRLNINSVRTCHYPDDPDWYDLCDEWGLLLVCECNLETHAVSGALSHNPAWASNFLERAIRMVLTHKNHPSIYSWSLGNESGVGANHAAMAGWIKEYDPDRICQYEAGNPGKNISDIRANMYAPVHEIMQMLTDPEDNRPIVLAEYLYQIRNSGGGMSKFYELVEKYKRFQGGYIWDWMDKALINKTDGMEEYYAYGGDFNESYVDEVHPGFMTNNGIIMPDLTPKPVALEVKHYYCPLIIEELKYNSAWVLDPGPGHLLIKNRNLVLDSSYYKLIYTVRENGYPIKTDELKIPLIKAGEEARVSLDIPFDKKPDKKYLLDISVRYARSNRFAPEGYELACFQFSLDGGRGLAISGLSGMSGMLSTETSIRKNVKDSDKADDDYNFNEKASNADYQDCLWELEYQSDRIVIKTKNYDFSVAFDKSSGLICSLIKDGTEYLISGPRECFTRPYSGIDAHDGWGRFPLWKAFDESRTSAKLESITVRPAGADMLVETVRSVRFSDYPCINSVNALYIIRPDGNLSVSFRFILDSALPDLPRIGVELIIPEDFESLKYFGRGPHENYRDRKGSAILAVHHSTVEMEHFPYNPPSENGGHEDCLWLSLSSNLGKAIVISSESKFHFDVHHNSIADYKKAGHEHELIRRKESYLHIDAAHSGIGGDMGWSSYLSEENKILAGSYYLEFWIRLK